MSLRDRHKNKKAEETKHFRQEAGGETPARPVIPPGPSSSQPPVYGQSSTGGHAQFGYGDNGGGIVQKPVG